MLNLGKPIIWRKVDSYKKENHFKTAKTSLNLKSDTEEEIPLRKLKTMKR